jgi:hypothetical protein
MLILKMKSYDKDMHTHTHTCEVKKEGDGLMCFKLRHHHYIKSGNRNIYLSCFQ